MNFGAQIAIGENETIEFKSAFNQEAVASVCAFANRRGGTVFARSEKYKVADKVANKNFAEDRILSVLGEKPSGFYLIESGVRRGS